MPEGRGRGTSDRRGSGIADIGGEPVSGSRIPPGATGHTLLVHSTPRRDDYAVAAWVAEAVDKGEKCKHAPQAARRLRRALAGGGIDPEVLGSGQVELVDAASMGARCGGRHDRLGELHAELAEQAQRAGYPGLAVTGDGAAGRALTRDGCELAAHERDLERLVTRRLLRSLCRYHPATDEPALADMLTIHHRDVADDIWTATVTDGRLCLGGEIDASNVHRLTHVLAAGLADGVRLVDLGELRFCAVAGVRAFRGVAETLAADGGELAVVDVEPLLLRNFTIIGDGRQPGLRLLAREAR